MHIKNNDLFLTTILVSIFTGFVQVAYADGVVIGERPVIEHHVNQNKIDNGK